MSTGESYSSSDLLVRAEQIVDNATRNGEEYPTYSTVKRQLVKEYGAEVFERSKAGIQQMLLKVSTELRRRDKHIEVVLLFDVDETLVTAENSLKPYQYNETLMRVWRKMLNCLTCVRTSTLLFTSQSLCTPAFVYRPEEEPRAEPSRIKLRRHLRDKYNIRVPGVITTYDGVYDLKYEKKIGAYYRDNIEPFERRVQSGKVIEYDDKVLLEKKMKEKQLSELKQKYQMKLQEEERKEKCAESEDADDKDTTKSSPARDKSKRLSDRGGTRVKTQGPKSLMIRYLVGYLQKHRLIRPGRCTKIVLFDDRKDVLSCVASVCSTLWYPSIQYLGVLVTQDRSESSYASQVYSFLKSEFHQYARLRGVAKQMMSELESSHGPIWRRRHGCFTGRDAIQWLVLKGHAVSEMAAIGAAQALLDHELIRAVEETNQSLDAFVGGKNLYEVSDGTLGTAARPAD